MSEVANLKTIETLDRSPFKYMVATIGNLPTSFVDSMSYYECIAWLVKYLETEVIPAVNNNAEAVAELQAAYTQLKEYVDNYFDNLDVQDEIDHKLDEMAADGTLERLLLHYFKADRDIIVLDNNLLTTSTQWTLGAGWSGNFTDGFLHQTGSTEKLSCTIDVDEGEMYVLKFTATNQYASTTEQAIIAQFGGSPVFEQYYNDGTVTKHFTFYPENGVLEFTPSTNWQGIVRAIGIYKVPETDKLEQVLKTYDANDEVSLATTITKESLDNTIIGKESMQYITNNSHNNVVLGNNALEKTATGYYNTAIGSYSQQNSIDGTRNVSVGFNSLNGITYGDRNIAVGTFALHKVTTGRNNIGIGADSAWNTTTGNNNIALSNGALNANTTGSNNIALGYFACAGNTTGQYNFGVGHMVNNYNQTGNGNIAVGYMAHYKGTADTHNIAIGYQSMTEHTVTGDYQKNIAIGYQAMNKSGGNDNVAIGEMALKQASNTTNNNVAIGYDVMSQTVTSSGENVVIGKSSGRNIAGSYNIAFGSGTLNGACGNLNIAIGSGALENTTGTSNLGVGYQAGKYVSSGEKNIIIGHATGNNITTAKNCIIIGASLNGNNEDNFIQIGSALQGTGSQIGLGGAGKGANCAINTPAGTTTVAPLRLNAGSLLTTPGNGCIEFDGTHLYITINNNRVTIV